MTYGSRATASFVMSLVFSALIRETLYTRWTSAQYRGALQGSGPDGVRR